MKELNSHLPAVTMDVYAKVHYWYKPLSLVVRESRALMYVNVINPCYFETPYER